jgi:mRNA interferase RelE/StbE
MPHVEFTSEAEKSLSRIEKHFAQRILKKLRWLAENFEYIHHEALAAQFAGAYKLRVGNYRVIYTIEKAETDLIIIHLVGHRREIYK